MFSNYYSFFNNLFLFFFFFKNDYFDHFGNFDKVGRNLDSDMKFGIITWPLAYVWNYGSEEQKKLIMVSLLIFSFIANVTDLKKKKLYFCYLFTLYDKNKINQITVI